MELNVQYLGELEDDELLTREHFAPMKRLLSAEDEEYLRAQGCVELAKQNVRDHRQAYNGYLKELSYQVRRQRAFWKLAMSGARNWDIRADIRKTLICEAALLHLRWLGWKRSFGIRVDTAVIEKYLAILVPEFSPFSDAHRNLRVLAGKVNVAIKLQCDYEFCRVLGNFLLPVGILGVADNCCRSQE